MGELIRTLRERLEAEGQLQGQMQALRDDYLEQNPGETECVVFVLGTPGPTAALYVGPPIRKARQERIAT